MNPDPPPVDEISRCSLSLEKSCFTSWVHSEVVHCPLLLSGLWVDLDWHQMGVGDPE
jgi:hypothetical protein